MAKEVSMYAIHDAHIVANITPKLEWLRADTLRAASYQRALQPSWGRRIAREFDPDKFWPLIVSRRPDGDYVLDGQHRLYAVRDVLNWGDQNVPCLIYAGLTLEMETKLFNTQTTRGRKPITALDELHSDYVGGDPTAVAIVGTVERARLHLDWNNSSSDGTVRAAATLRTVYSTHGSARLLETLALLRDTFGMPSRVFQTAMIVGMAAFLVRYTDDEAYSRAEFVRKVGKYSVDEILQRARAQAVADGKSTHGANMPYCGRAMMGLYNQGRRTNRLLDWQENYRDPKAEKVRGERIGEYNRTFPRLA